MPSLIAPQARLERAIAVLLKKAEHPTSDAPCLFLADPDVELAFHDLRVWMEWKATRRYTPRIEVAPPVASPDSPDTNVMIDMLQRVHRVGRYAHRRSVYNPEPTFAEGRAASWFRRAWRRFLSH